MPRDRVPAGCCAACGKETITCFYNHFENAAEIIDSWEHRCTNCGGRETNAFRRAKDAALDVDPRKCPFCGRQAPA